jgi:hypothetical protein
LSLRTSFLTLTTRPTHLPDGKTHPPSSLRRPDSDQQVWAALREQDPVTARLLVHRLAQPYACLGTTVFLTESLENAARILGVKRYRG